MNQRKAGVILSYISMGLHSVIALVYVPMLLYYLSKDQFGIYQLMGSMLSYLYLMDFGLANTTTRYLAQALSLADKQRERNIIAASHTLYTGIALLVVLVGIIFYLCVPLIYSSSLSPADLHTAKQICLILLLNIAVFIPSRIFTAVINAHERFLFGRGLGVLQTCLHPLLVWGILAWKASVINLVIVQTCTVFANILLQYLYCKIKLHTSFPLLLHKSPLFKELTGFSVFVFLHSLMDQVYSRSGQLILGAVVGVLAVTNYSIAMQVAMFAICLPVMMSSVFLPKLSASVAKQHNLTQCNDLFCKLGRLQFMLFMLLIGGFAFLGKTFLLLWIGPGYNVCYWIVLILFGGYLIDVTQNVGIPILQALKKHAFRAYIYTAMAALNIVLAIVLSKFYGEIGCAVATASCLILGSGFIINWYYWHIGIDIWTFFKNLGKLSIPILGALGIIWELFLLWPLHTSWISFIFHGSVLTVVYTSILWKFACNSYEKNLILIPLQQIISTLKKNQK